MTQPISTHAIEETIPVFVRTVGSWQVSLKRQAFRSPELRELYDRAAPGWSQTLDRLGMPGAYESLFSKLVNEEAGTIIRPRPRVLDCGVGTGALSVALSRVLRAPFLLDAIDLSPRMLERADRILRNKNIVPTLRQGDACALPYDDGVFDLVMCAHMLEHLADPRHALSEMRRVLKPGGVMVACLTRRSAMGLFVRLKWRTHGLTPAEAEAWLTGAGFFAVRSLSFGTRPRNRGLSVACVGTKVPSNHPHAADHVVNQ